MVVVQTTTSPTPVTHFIAQRNADTELV